MRIISLTTGGENYEISRARFSDAAGELHSVKDVMRADAFGAEELGSTSGVFVFTDRGGDKIERAVLGRRWGATQRERGEQSKLVEESGAYDIITTLFVCRNRWEAH